MDPPLISSPSIASPSMLCAGPQVYLSKTAVIRMIEEIPFDEIGVPLNVVSDQPESAPAFLRAVGLALVDILVNNSLDRASPARILSRTSSFRRYDSKPDTPTKPPLVKEPKSVGSSVAMTAEPADGRIFPPFNESTQVTKQREDCKQPKNETDDLHPLPLPKSTPSPTKPQDESITPIRVITDPEQRASGRNELKSIDLNKNPYHVIRIERTPDTKYPRILIEGQIDAPTDDDGNIIPGFDRDYYNIKGFALLDNGGDTCYVVSDIIGVDITSRHSASFNFTIRGIAGVLINTTVKIVPRKILPNGFEEADIVIGQHYCTGSLTYRIEDIIKSMTASHLLGQPYKIADVSESKCPDFASSCSLLLDFVHNPKPGLYSDQITNCVQFICDEWWGSDAPLTDVRDVSPYYLYLLVSQGLVRTLHLYDLNQVKVPENLLLRAMVMLFQILLRILEQQSNGSWCKLKSSEEISYAIISLTHLSCLPFVGPLSQKVEDAIQQGRNYLEASVGKDANKTIWVKMDSNGTENIRHSFVLAALNAPLRHCVFGARVNQLLPNESMGKLDKLVKFFTALPLFRGIDEWMLRAWLIEGYLFMPELSKRRLEIFTEQGTKKDKYLDYIPFSFTGPMRLMKFRMSAQTQLNMMICFILIYQADEFFDGYVVTGDLTTMARVRKSVETIFSQLHADLKATSIGEMASREDFDETIYQQLDRYVRFIVSIPQIQTASQIDKAHLELEAKALLLANVQQCEDNLRLKCQASTKVHSSPSSTYNRWVRSTASDHVTFQYSFAFLIAMLSTSEDFLQNIQIRYTALDCVARTAVIGRMINDYGSLSRDRKEMNLNSVFFPEFEGEVKSDEELCAELMSLVNYERRLLEVSFEELKGLCANAPKVYETVRFFNVVIEFYNQVYERRDISNWV